MSQMIYRLQIRVGAAETYQLVGFVAAVSAAPARNGLYGIDVWYIVDDSDPRGTELTVSVAGTGHPLVAGETLPNYVGTCVMSDDLVWHVFAERK